MKDKLKMKPLRRQKAFEKFKTPGKSSNSTDDEDGNKKKRLHITLPLMKQINKKKESIIKGGTDNDAMNFELLTDTFFTDPKPPSSPDYVASHTRSDTIAFTHLDQAQKITDCDEKAILSPKDCLNDLARFENKVTKNTFRSTNADVLGKSHGGSNLETSKDRGQRCTGESKKQEVKVENEIRNALSFNVSSKDEIVGIEESSIENKLTNIDIHAEDCFPEEEFLEVANAFVSWMKEHNNNNTDNDIMSKFLKQVKIKGERSEKKEKVLKNKIALKGTGSTPVKEYESNDLGTELQYKTPIGRKEQQTTVVLPSNQQSYCEILTTSPSSAKKSVTKFDKDSNGDLNDDSTDEFIAFKFNDFITKEAMSQSSQGSNSIETDHDKNLDESASFGPKTLTFPDTSNDSIKMVEEKKSNLYEKDDASNQKIDYDEKTTKPPSRDTNDVASSCDEAINKISEKSQDSLDVILCGNDTSSFETFHSNLDVQHIAVTEVETEQDSGSWSNGFFTVDDKIADSTSSTITPNICNRAKNTSKVKSQDDIGNHIDLQTPEHEQQKSSSLPILDLNILSSEHILMTKTSDMIQSIENLVQGKAKHLVSTPNQNDVGEQELDTPEESHNDDNFRRILKGLVKDIILGHDCSLQKVQKGESPLLFKDGVDNNFSSPVDVTSFPCSSQSKEIEEEKTQLNKIYTEALIDEQLEKSIDDLNLFSMKGIPTVSERIASLQTHLQSGDR